MAKQFFVKSNFLSALGVVDVPAMHMLEEALMFVIPSVIGILQRQQKRGGIVYSVTCHWIADYCTI